MDAIQAVVRDGNCLGCGLCVAMGGRGDMVEDFMGFLVPSDQARIDRSKLGRICPGLNQSLGEGDDPGHSDWGRILQLEEICSTDEDLRRNASSGGGLSALAAYLLESGTVSGVLQVRAAKEDPLANELRISRTLEEVRSCVASRYAPAVMFPPWFSELVNSKERYLFVGKPCDVAAVRHLQRMDPAWLEAIPLTFAIFCAGIPSRTATRLLSESLGVRGELRSVKYRGGGWPGEFVATDSTGATGRVGYDVSWGQHLNRHLHPRCKICPDGVGMQADISFGDAWETDSGYPDFQEKEGRSLAVIRTIQGKSILSDASLAGFVTILGSVEVDRLEKMQPYQMHRRRLSRYRMLGKRLAGGSVPKTGGHKFPETKGFPAKVEGAREAWGNWKRTIKFHLKKMLKQGA